LIAFSFLSSYKIADDFLPRIPHRIIGQAFFSRFSLPPQITKRFGFQQTYFFFFLREQIRASKGSDVAFSPFFSSPRTPAKAEKFGFLPLFPHFIIRSQKPSVTPLWVAMSFFFSTRGTNFGERPSPLFFLLARDHLRVVGVP